MTVCVLCRTHPPRQAAERAHSCDLCREDLWQKLDDLATLTPFLEALVEPSILTATRKASGDSAPAPARVEVLALLDIRGDLSLSAVLGRHAARLAAERKLSGKVEPIRSLRAHVDWLTAQPDVEWLTDLARDVDRLHREVLRVCGEATSTVGRHTANLGGDDCGGEIVASPWTPFAICQACGTRWPRSQWRVIGARQEDAC